MKAQEETPTVLGPEPEATSGPHRRTGQRLLDLCLGFVMWAARSCNQGVIREVPRARLGCKEIRLQGNKAAEENLGR